MATSIDKEGLNIDDFIETLKKKEPLPEDDVEFLGEKAKEVFSQEENLVNVPAPVTICGDTHGQFYDLLELFRIGGDLPETNYLFLGNYINRGYYSVETISLLLAFKVRYKNRITLLRGNHENSNLSQVFGFYDEVISKYNNPKVWFMFCEVFNGMPLVALIDNQIGGIHGGLSPSIDTLDQIKDIERFGESPFDGPAGDFLWSDPTNYEHGSGWIVPRGGSGYGFAQDISEQWNHANDLKYTARAHQLMMNGYKWIHDLNIVTIFSAPNYCYRCGNQAAIMQINENLSHFFHKYSPGPRPKEISKAQKRIPDYFL